MKTSVFSAYPHHLPKALLDPDRVPVSICTAFLAHVSQHMKKNHVQCRASTD